MNEPQKTHNLKRILFVMIVAMATTLTDLVPTTENFHGQIQFADTLGNNFVYKFPRCNFVRGISLNIAVRGSDFLY